MIRSAPENIYNDFISACRNGKLAQVREYVENRGCDVNYINSDEWTPLGYAAYNGYTAIARYLLEKGAQVDLPCAGRMPRDWALYSGDGAKGCAEFLKGVEDALIASKAPEWSLLGDTQLAHVVYSPALHRRMTEIFNFESRERLTISESLTPYTETVLPATSFDNINEKALRTAFERFTSLGGQTDEAFVLKGTMRLDKKNHLTGQQP